MGRMPFSRAYAPGCFPEGEIEPPEDDDEDTEDEDECEDPDDDDEED